jgi:inner membrane protease ATP23
MSDVLTHELIHTYDNCRAHVDWSNDEHVACTEIRAASLSGECFFWKENFARLKFGIKKHHQVILAGVCGFWYLEWVGLVWSDGTVK